MKLLALDTSSDACTVAVGHDDTVVSRHALAAREHTRLLMPMIEEAMSESALDFRDLDGIVLGNGPGSFIGMRIGAAVVQGIAFASELPVVPVSSMAALALQTLEEHSEDYVAVAQDAHMQEVYFGLYARSAEGLMAGAGSERLAGRGPLDELLALPERSCIAAGLGWRIYPDLFAGNEARIAGRSSNDVPDARFVLQLGEAALARGEKVAAADVDPVYLRQQVASTSTGKVP
jgi:tRNA threonylcarbamoyladenosine biosynthesis protein TsaB